MKTNYILLVASLSLGLISCGKGDELESVKSELSDKRSALAVLKKEIKSLEIKADSLSGKGEDKRQVVNVDTLVASKFESYVKVNGVVASDNNVNVVPEGGGVIRSVLIKRGATVRAGQALAYLDSDILSKNLKELEGQLAFATTMFNKQKSLFDQKVGTEVQYLDAKNRKESLEKSIETLKSQKAKNVITAPVSGRIDEIFGSVGEMATQMAPFARIVNTSGAYIEADLSEEFVGRIKMGDPVKVTYSSNNQTFTTKVSYISNFINPNNRTFKVQVELPKTKDAIVPNMLTIVEFKNITVPNAIVVNNTAINTDLNGDYVFVVEKENNKLIAKKVSVKRGNTYQNLTVVKEGLSASQLMVNRRYQNLDNGDEVKLK
jgi:membrane fusion protein, multidrug efflux system